MATPVRIVMASSASTAQLRGVTGEPTDGVTLNGTYVSQATAHEFDVVKSGVYTLWEDPAGGSSYSRLTWWSGTDGKFISGDDIEDIRQKVHDIRHSKNYSSLIDAAKDGGASPVSGHIVASPGTDAITQDVVLLASDTTLEGSRSYKLDHYKNDQGESKDAIRVSSDYSNVVIRGFEIDGNASATYGTEWDMGIAVVGARNVLIEDMYIHDVGGDGIYIGRDGTGSYPTRRPEDIIIRNCVIDVPLVSDSPLVGRNGIAIVDGKNIIIEGCIIKGGYPAALDIEPDDSEEDVTNVIIRDCIFIGYKASQAGGGILSDCSRPVSNITIENCIVYNFYRGMFLRQTGSEVTERLTVKNCVVYDNDSEGIELGNVSNCMISGCDSYNNNIGIIIGGNCDNITMIGNSLHENSASGIWCYNGADSEHNCILIVGNRIFNNSQDSVQGYSAVLLQKSHQVLLDNNLIYDDRGVSVRHKYAVETSACQNLRIGSGNVEWGHRVRVDFDNQSASFSVGNRLAERKMEGTTQLKSDVTSSSFVVDGITSYHPTGDLAGYVIFNKTRYDEGGAGLTDAIYDISSNSVVAGGESTITLAQGVTPTDWDANDDVYIGAFCYVHATDQAAGAGHFYAAALQGVFGDDRQVIEVETARTADIDGSMHSAYYIDASTQREKGIQALDNKVGINCSPSTYALEVRNRIGYKRTSIDGGVIYPNSENIRNLIDAGGGGINVVGDDEALLKVHSVDNASLISVAAFTRDGSDNPRVLSYGELEIDGDLNHDGSNIGFYATAPIAQAVLATGGGATVDNVITALQNLGLVKQS